MADRAFTEDDLKAWAMAAEEHRPETATVPECLMAPHAISFSMRARRNGLTLRVAADDGQTTTLHINPAVAQFVREEILRAGQVCGWMDEQGHITYPLSNG